MDIIVTGRSTEISQSFRDQIEEKLARIEQLAPNVHRIDVVVTEERNPRQANHAQRVELTARGKGPIVRAEASAADRLSALDLASARLNERLRRARDRRKDRRQSAAPMREVFADVPAPQKEAKPQESKKPHVPTQLDEIVESQVGDSPVIVRQKLHKTTPMSVDEALYQMELVGHPFYLFIDEETMQPCAVYHRRGWTYGVIRLDATVTMP